MVCIAKGKARTPYEFGCKAAIAATSREGLVLAAKARALLSGRHAVSIDDVRAVARPALRHRIHTNFEARADGVTTDGIVDDLVESVVLARA